MAALGMEALQGQRLLTQCGYGYSVGSISNSNLPAAAGHGGGSFATTFQAGRVSLSSPAMAFPTSSLTFSRQCSLVPVYNSGKDGIHCCLRRDRTLCTTAINWLCPSSSSFPSFASSSSSRGGTFRVAFAGNWASDSSTRRRSTQRFRELLLFSSQPPANRGKSYSVAITSAPELQQRRATAAKSLLYKIIKISPSSIFSWLRKRRGVLEVRPARHLSTGYTWRAPALQRVFQLTSSSPPIVWAEVYLRRLPRHHRVGASKDASEYYSGYSSVSSQAEGNGLLENATLDQQQQQQKWSPNDERGEFVATGYGWRVRDVARGDLQDFMSVADIQTDAFHEKSAVFDDLLYKIFHAEVLSSLQYKARHSAPDRYACLLAERDPSQLESLEESQDEGEQIIVGAVDVTAFSDKDIVSHLPGADEYLYVSGMAVDSNYRRRSVATLLLEACLLRALEWGFDYLVLHAYEDDFRARNLYSRAGYQTVSADPAWMSKFFGRRRRVVMAKRTREILNST